MSKRLVVLGGSSLNTPALFGALANSNGLPVDEVCLVGRSEESVEVIGQFCRMIVEHLNIPATVCWETDVSRAATGARYILNMIRVGGIEGQIEDRRNLALSGVVGHAAGYAEAIRNLGPTLDAVQKIEATAPKAIFVNFANPVSVLCEAIALSSSVPCIGICHHAFSIGEDFAALLGADEKQVFVNFLGINHIGWVTDVQVDGQSQMGRLMGKLIEQKNKKYNYRRIQPFGLIPIDHAFSLYRKGEVVYVRQKGIRGSLQDALIKFNPVDRTPKKCCKQRDELREAIRSSRMEVIDTLRARAPWYETCIIPFLEALDSGRSHDFIVTWRHEGQVPGLPSITAESTTTIEKQQVRNVEEPGRLPAFASAWLRQVRDSERLIIRAIREQSFETALEAMVIHPNVASVEHAKRFLRHYFPQGAR